MAFIRTQRLSFNEDGSVAHGTASIIDTEYVKGDKYHSKQVIRECLGKIIYISGDKKSGIFLSATRGLVEYNARTDSFQAVEKDDERISGTGLFPQTEVHTVFGDTYMLLKFLEKAGLIPVLKSVFPKDGEYERLLCHICMAF